MVGCWRPSRGEPPASSFTVGRVEGFYPGSGRNLEDGVLIAAGDIDDVPVGDSEKRLVFRNYFTTATCSWLLIFDNSNYEIETDRQILEECLPTTGKGKILITTQTAIPFESAPQVQVDVFSKEDALDFLWKRTGIQPDECVEKIIEAYEQHPLALEYAGAYISQPGGSYEKYLQVLTEKGTIRLLERNRFGAGANNYKRTVAEAFQISLNAIQEEARKDDVMSRVEPCLRFIAALLGDCIYVPFVQRIHETLKPPLNEAFRDTLATDEIVFVLTKYSLMTRDGDWLYMHRLLREIILEGMEYYGYPEAWEFSTNYVDVFLPRDNEHQAIIEQYRWENAFQHHSNLISLQEAFRMMTNFWIWYWDI